MWNIYNAHHLNLSQDDSPLKAGTGRGGRCSTGTDGGGSRGRKEVCEPAGPQDQIWRPVWTVADTGGKSSRGTSHGASHCPRRPRQARTQQKPQRDGACGSDRPVPFPDVTYTFSPNRVSLVLFLLLFGKKRSGYRGQQSSDGSTLRRKLLRVRAVWKL